MKKTDVITGIVLASLGLLFLLVIIPNQTFEGEEDGLQPDFFPNVIMVVVTLMAVLFLMTSIFGKTKANALPAPITGRNAIYVTAFCGFLFLVLAAFKYLGYIPGSIILFSTLMLYLGNRNPIRIILFSLLIPLSAYFLLRHGLGVILP